MWRRGVKVPRDEPVAPAPQWAVCGLAVSAAGRRLPLTMSDTTKVCFRSPPDNFGTPPGYTVTVPAGDDRAAHLRRRDHHPQCCQSPHHGCQSPITAIIPHVRVRLPVSAPLGD